MLTEITISKPLPSFINPFTMKEVPAKEPGEVINVHPKLADLLVRKKRARYLINSFARWNQ